MEDRVSRENGVLTSNLQSLPRIASNSKPRNSLIASAPEMSQRIRWSDKAECYLIDFYKENEGLWDPKHEHYYKRDVRDSLLMKLCGTWTDQFGFNITIRDVKEKFKNLRTTYLRELKKVRESKNRGDALQYRPRWIHYNVLEFLRDVMKAEDGTESTEIIIQDYLQESDDRTDRLSDEENVEDNKALVSTTFPPIVQIMEENNSYTPLAKKQRVDDSQPPVRVINGYTEATPKIYMTANGVPEEDPETLFSRYIAASLRRLSRLSCEKAKLDIQHVILKHTEESL